MKPEDALQLVGTAGTVAVLLYIANALWTAHKDDDKTIRDEKKLVETVNDKLVDTVKDSTALLKEVRDDLRAMRDEDRHERRRRPPE